MNTLLFLKNKYLSILLIYFIMYIIIYDDANKRASIKRADSFPLSLVSAVFSNAHWFCSLPPLFYRNSESLKYMIIFIYFF